MNAPVRTRFRAGDSMAPELRQLIQTEDPMVGQRHLARHRDVAAADPLRIREGVVGRATRAGRDERRPVADAPCQLRPPAR
jgi:hypothetical protein